MGDYEFLEPASAAPGLDLALGLPPRGPPKPPRHFSESDLLDRRERPPQISVTAPLDSAGDGGRGLGRRADTLDRRKLAGSFDSLDSETMVSVGDMADLDTLLADLQSSIGQMGGSGHSSPARSRKVPPFQPLRTASPSHITETMTETKRTVKREVTPPPDPAAHSGGGVIRELDSLLQDLSEARHSDASPARGISSPGYGKTLAVRFSPDEPDMVPSPNAKTFETRTVTVTESVPEGCTNTSSATQELDDLMASLSDFKIHATSYQKTVVEETHEPPYQPERAEELDSMLGSLQDDLSKQGVNTAHKGICAACDKPIAGQVITALGKTWHTEHFTCCHCNMELGNKNFFERDGKPYCETDYHELFSPRCAYCDGPIMDKCVTALGRTWHPEHFFCAQCGQPFGESGFHERDGKAYCRADYFSMFAPRCAGCSQPVMENYISALNAQWHPECFVCKDCKQTFEQGSFFEHEGQPYCETHYHAKRGSLCAGCHKPITGRCVTAMFKKFHPEHFVCSFCLKQLNKGTFKEQADKPYCHQCFDKLFG